MDKKSVYEKDLKRPLVLRIVIGCKSLSIVLGDGL